MSFDDQLQTFLLDRAGVRGALVRLGPAWRSVAAQQPYSAPVRGLLGEALAASALLTAHIKFEGALSIEYKSAGALRLLFAECTDGGRLRGLAHGSAAAAGAAADTPAATGFDLAAADALLAITLGSVEAGSRYQGLVGVSRAGLAATLEDYFAQSEQLPTRIVLAADAEHAAGLLLQQLPGSVTTDADAWPRVGLLTATLAAQELLTLPPAELLYRLYHEEAPRLYAPRALAFGCSCSRTRVEAMLRVLGAQEVQAALDARGGEIEVICEFCAARYTFDAVDAARLLAATPNVPASSTPH